MSDSNRPPLRFRPSSLLAALGADLAVLLACIPSAHAGASDSMLVTDVVARTLAEARDKGSVTSPARTLAHAAMEQAAELEARLAKIPLRAAGSGKNGSRKFSRATAEDSGFSGGTEKKKADWEVKLRSARSAWLELLVREPGSPWTEQAPDGLSALDAIEGRIRLRRGEIPESIELFSRSFARLWKASRLSIVPLRVIDDFSEACSRERKARIEDCRHWLKLFVDRSSESAPERAAILARHAGLLRAAAASPSEERLVGTYKARDADEAAFADALGLISQRRVPEAGSALLRFLEEFPRSSLRFRARWWIAKLRGREGDAAAAGRWRASVYRESPFSYYGLEAALGESKVPGEGLVAEIPPARARDPQLNPLEAERWSLAESLAAEGEMEAAAIELADLEARAGFGSEFLCYGIELATRVGAHATALRWATELLKRDVPWGRTSYATRWIFPLPERILPVLERAARREEVDPLLLLSLAKQESAFDADALSPAGAAGLVQLMPATALDVMPKVERAELRDPDRSLTGGARYLRRMLNRYDGNVALALAAYNAGPGAVDRWIGEGFASGSQAAFIERIPYKETRDYVAAILRNRWWYRRITAGMTDSVLDADWRPRGAPPAEKSMGDGIQWAVSPP